VTRICIVALAAVIAAVAPARAQRAPVFLEPGHWTHDAIRRLSAAGLAPGNADPAEAPVTTRHAWRVFAHATQRAATDGRPQLAALARGYLERLSEETDSTGVVASVALRGGWLAARGEARGGEGFFADEDWVGAQPLRGMNEPAGTVHAAGYFGRGVSWQVAGGRLGAQWVIPAASLSAAVGGFDVWAGRRRPYFGAGRGGALVLGAGINEPPDFAHRTLAIFDGIGAHVRDPFDFPGFLRFLGPARIEILAGRLPANGRVESPYVVFGRLTTTPFGDRFMLGVNRGSIFGGEGNDITLRRLAGMLVGANSGEFENQIISAVMRYRPPLGSTPLELYLEFGADDLAGGWKDVPAYVAGFDLAAIPGMPALAVGVERSDYATSCCGNPPWYRHAYTRGSWSDQHGRLFAHPLGGNGSEWLLHTRLDAPAPGMFARVDVFTRQRRSENLFSPERQGRSRGVNATVEYAHGGLAVRGDATHEKGDAWEMSRAALMFSYRWPGRGAPPR
jgi:hypothetical protein